MRGLYVGRFQPFHLGHLSVVKEMLTKVDHIIIGIGSAEDNYQPENPFTASERFEMIEETLLNEGITREKFYIIPMRNINNYALWVSHISLLLPKFDVVYTGSPVIKRLFTLHGGYEIVDINKTVHISATEIRKKMLTDKNSWQKDLPNSVVNKIIQIEGVTRMKHLRTY